MVDRPRRGEPIRKIKLKDGRTRYRIVIDAGTDESGKRKQVSSTWDTLDEARTELARVRIETKSGTYVHKRETTLATFIEGWV